MRVLVTGANGFIGRAVCEEAVHRGVSVRGAIRTKTVMPAHCEEIAVGEIDGNTEWDSALQGCDTVVHLAARVHVMQDKEKDPRAEFRKVNVEGTLNLARQAARSGIHRFVFISSIKVNGESSITGHPFTADDAVAPADPYAFSKAEAETRLLALGQSSGMEVVIIRPPLVYGPGVRANFRSLLKWLATGIPLPLGAITHNRRSLVGLDNLVDFILVCAVRPEAANQIFMVSDGEDVSTSDLLRRAARALEVPARLMPVSPKVLVIGAHLLGRPAAVERLCGNLQVDITKSRELLGWNPPLSLDEGLRRAAQAFLHEATV